LLPQSVEKRLINLLTLCGPATTLAISPWFSFDPINLIKTLVLSCFAFGMFGLLLPYFPQIVSQFGKVNLILISIFFASLFLPFFFSGANKSQQFWGVFGRNTGILTYISLLIIFFTCAQLRIERLYYRLTLSLVFTVLLMTIYCLIQIAHLDPISWSAFFPFGTLGNVNFLSGFMGLGLVSVFILAFFNRFDKSNRILLLVLFISGTFVLMRSDSTQGVVGLAVGILTFLLIYSWYTHKGFFLFALVIYISGLISLVLGLFDKGPLREVIYQFTVLFRADYMHAGLQMLLKNPVFGIGIDSYDDWYRTERGVISAFRTSFNRTANSAHNISIDLAAGGGIPLLSSYILLIALVLLALLKGLRQGRAHDPIFMAISMSWIAYQVQASVSINQVGVGIWGWILGGALLGYSNLGIYKESSEVSAKLKKRLKSQNRSDSPNTPPALAVVSSTLFLVLGFTLAFLPFKTDIDFLQATKKGSAEEMLKVIKQPTANTFMLAKASSAAFQANLPDVGKEITRNLIERYPRNLYGWLTVYERPMFFGDLKNEAFQRIKEIDPYVAICYEPDSSEIFRKILDDLPSSEQYKLARGWGLAVSSAKLNPNRFSLSQISNLLLAEKIKSFCGY
jgi:O-antigen ligase